jgi:zinc protease
MASTQINLSSLPGPETIARRVFDNGITGLAHENFSSESAVVHGWVWAGGIDVPPEQAGLANLTASMLTRGTERRTFAQIGEEIESVGASLHVGSGGHTTRFTAKCLVEDLPLILDILADGLRHPTFPAEHVEKRRGEILTAIQQRDHDTQVVASLRFARLAYPDHPYGYSQVGYQDTVSSLTRADIEAYYRRCYGPQGMVIIVVGALAREHALELMEEALGTWVGTPRDRPSLPPVLPITAVREERAAIPGKTQSDLVLGWVGLERMDPGFIQAYVADCVLGQFGMMGRIGEHLRNEQGLAYYAYTSLDAGLGPGPWTVRAGVAPDDVERAIETILFQVRRLQREPVGQEELSDNKSFIIGSLPLDLEGNEEVAAQIASLELYQLGLDYLRRFPGLIEALTSEDLMAAAQRYLNPDAYVLSVAGPPQGDRV